MNTKLFSSTIGFALVFAVLTLVAAANAEAGGPTADPHVASSNFAVSNVNHPNEPATGPLTVVSLVTAPEIAGGEAHAELTLASFTPVSPSGFTGGLGEEAGRALVVAWVREDGGWFGPTWRLQLHSDRGLLPLGAPGAGQGTGRHPEWQTDFVALSTIPPQAGHTYETWMSFDPSSGALSLWIYDRDARAPVYADRLSLSPTDAPLQAGAVGPDASGPGAARVTAYPFFVPRSVGWGLVEYIDGEAGPSPGGLVDRRLSLAAALRYGAPSPGWFYLLAEQDGVVRQLAATRANSESELLIPIAAHELAHGTATLRLEYRYAEKVLFAEERELRVGRIEFDVGNAALEYDGARPVLTGRVELEADGPFPALEIELEYEIGVPTRIAPLHENWRTASGSAVVPVADVRAGRTRAAFTIPLNISDEILKQRVPYVTLNARVKTDAGAFESGPRYGALAHRHSPFPDVGPYAVLRGDFHIHTSESHDSEVSPEWRVWEAFRYGYDAIALTDHGNTRAYDRARSLADELGLIVLRGFETGLDNANSGEHFTLIGIDASFAPRDPHMLSREPGRSRLFYQDEFRSVVARGGLVVYAHPGWPNSRLESDAVRWLVDNGLLHGVEVRGPRERLNWAFNFALAHGLAFIEGSDVHEARDLDLGHQAPVTLILVEEPGPQGVLDALRAGRTLVWRSGVLRGPEAWLRPFIEAMVDIVPGECATIVNKSPLPLRAVVRPAPPSGDAERIRIVALEPFMSACLSFAALPSSVEIQWENVYTSPNATLRTAHALAGRAMQ